MENCTHEEKEGVDSWDMAKKGFVKGRKLSILMKKFELRTSVLELLMQWP